ncbi:MAG: transposase [Desulfovibrio sp.]
MEPQTETQRLDPEQIVARRAEKSRPILDKRKALLDRRVPTTPPQSLLGGPIGSALKQWDRPAVYPEDGRQDNNLTGNAIHSFAVVRKNWVFSGHPRGDYTSAILYSRINTANVNGIEPYSYLCHLFNHLIIATIDAKRKIVLPQSLDSKKPTYLFMILSIHLSIPE